KQRNKNRDLTTGSGDRRADMQQTLIQDAIVQAMDSEESKYTRIEYERRFLVSPHSDWHSVVEPYSKTFEDKYLRQARLRLRILTDSDTGRRVMKLTKKFESASPYHQRINRILLSTGEYELLDSLEGDRLKKVR